MSVDSEEVFLYRYKRMTVKEKKGKKNAFVSDMTQLQSSDAGKMSQANVILEKLSVTNVLKKQTNKKKQLVNQGPFENHEILG